MGRTSLLRMPHNPSPAPALVTTDRFLRHTLDPAPQLERSVPITELAEAHSVADGAKADLRAAAAGRLRSLIGWMHARKKVEKLERELSILRGATVAASPNRPAEQALRGAVIGTGSAVVVGGDSGGG